MNCHLHSLILFYLGLKLLFKSPIQIKQVDIYDLSL